MVPFATPIEDWIQYFFMAAAVIALYYDRRGMKRYVPVALFANIYAKYICMFGLKAFHLWTYPSRLTSLSDTSLPAEGVVIPIIAMFWVRYCPRTLQGTLLWTLAWSFLLSLGEYFAERYTGLIRYHNGYDWYYTLLLWLVTFPFWLLFHNWLYADRSRR